MCVCSIGLCVYIHACNEFCKAYLFSLECIDLSLTVLTVHYKTIEILKLVY